MFSYSGNQIGEWSSISLKLKTFFTFKMMTNGTISHWCIPKWEPNQKSDLQMGCCNISSSSPTNIIKPIPTWTWKFFVSKMRYPPSEIQKYHILLVNWESLTCLQNHTTWIYDILEKNTSCVPNLYTFFFFYILSVFFSFMLACVFFLYLYWI